MRKYLIALVALAMVLGITSVAMGGAGNPVSGPISDSIGAEAIVSSWASVTPEGSLSFAITDPTVDTDSSGGATFTAATNCPLTLELTDNNLDLGVISATYAATDGIINIASDGGATGTQAAATTHTYTVTGVAAAPGIGVASGSYSGTVTLTVTSP